GKEASLGPTCLASMVTTDRLSHVIVIVEDLRKREGRNLVAAGVYGSVARGEDRQHSDIDLIVVVRRKRLRIRHTLDSGILVTFLQETTVEARNEVRGAYTGLNEALWGWRYLLPIYDLT